MTTVAGVYADREEFTRTLRQEALNGQRLLVTAESFSDAGALLAAVMCDPAFDHHGPFDVGCESYGGLLLAGRYDIIAAVAPTAEQRGRLLTRLNPGGALVELAATP